MISGQDGTVLFENGKTKITLGYSDKSGRVAKSFNSLGGKIILEGRMAKIFWGWHGKIFLMVRWQNLFWRYSGKKFFGGREA